MPLVQKIPLYTPRFMPRHTEPLTPELLRKLAYFNGMLSTSQVLTYLLEGQFIYTNLSKWRIVP